MLQNRLLRPWRESACCQCLKKKIPAVTAVSAATPALSGGGSANSSWNATTKLGNAVKVIPKVTYAAGKLYMFDDVCAQGKLIMDGALTYYQCGHE